MKLSINTEGLGWWKHRSHSQEGFEARVLRTVMVKYLLAVKELERKGYERAVRHIGCSFGELAGNQGGVLHIDVAVSVSPADTEFKRSTVVGFDDETNQFRSDVAASIVKLAEECFRCMRHHYHTSLTAIPLIE